MEAELQSLLKSPFVVPVYGICVSSQGSMLVMEYCNFGSLSNYLSDINRNRAALRVGEGMQFAFDIVSGLYYIHSMNIVHRDIRSDNILLKVCSNKIRAKICDFGIARSFGFDDQSISAVRFNISPKILGPARYLAPEIQSFNDNKLPRNVHKISSAAPPSKISENARSDHADVGVNSCTTLVNLHTPASDMLYVWNAIVRIYSGLFPKQNYARFMIY